MAKEPRSSEMETQNIAEGRPAKVPKVETKQLNVKLKTADDITFEVEASIVKEMETVQSFINATDTDASTVITLHNVTSRVLNQIVEYCSERSPVAGAANLKALKEFDEQFTEALSLDEMKELVLAANYLNMKKLLDLLTTSIANAIKNKSVEFVRNFFGVTNDYTPKEEAQFRQANAYSCCRSIKQVFVPQ